jgi:8-oxo-dGTP pyrophosphatase MutT (NUDIX family)
MRNNRILRMTDISPAFRGQAGGKSIRVSQLGKMRRCEQVAAVCYRVRRGAIEFLLVQTRGSGRWIFPKGSAELGLTYAQAAAIEAFEEAGVHGRIEESAFLQYVLPKQGDLRNAARSAAKSVVVSAHLCEVRRLGSPKEANRNRTWFSVKETAERLRKGRKNEDGEEFARVVRQAVARIKRLRDASDLADRTRPQAPRDGLYTVQFEALPETRRHPDQARRFTLPATLPHPAEFVSGEVLPFALPRQLNRNGRLLSTAMRVKALGSGAKNC